MLFVVLFMLLLLLHLLLAEGLVSSRPLSESRCIGDSSLSDNLDPLSECVQLFLWDFVVLAMQQFNAVRLPIILSYHIYPLTLYTLSYHIYPLTLYVRHLTKTSLKSDFSYFEWHIPF